MKKETDAALMKSNSSNASIKLGYRLYATNFAKIFRTSWLCAVVYALVCSLLGTITLDSFIKLSMTIKNSPEQTIPYIQQHIGIVILATVLFIAGGLCEIAFYSCGLSQLYKHKTCGEMSLPSHWYSIDKAMLWRTVKAVAVNALFVTAAFCVIMGTFAVGIVAKMPHLATSGLTISLGIILGFLLLPLIYVSFRYLLNPETKIWTLIGKEYRTGLKHLGYIFAVSLFSAIILLIAVNVLTLPTIILGLANSQAYLGAMEGDPLNMPSYAPLLTAILVFIAGFIQVYVRMSIFFPFYYMTGSIETQEQERKQYKEETANEDLTILT